MKYFIHFCDLADQYQESIEYTNKLAEQNDCIIFRHYFFNAEPVDQSAKILLDHLIADTQIHYVTIIDELIASRLLQKIQHQKNLGILLLTEKLLSITDCVKSFCKYLSYSNTRELFNTISIINLSEFNFDFKKYLQDSIKYIFESPNRYHKYRKPKSSDQEISFTELLEHDPAIKNLEQALNIVQIKRNQKFQTQNLL